MSEIVNLRLARKRKRRAEKDSAAAENRVAYGRGAGEKAATRQTAELSERRLEGHRREPDPER
jgi:hypothetical protein